jgi:hypothetical protein
VTGDHRSHGDPGWDAVASTTPPRRSRYRTVWWSAATPVTVLGVACAFLLLGVAAALLLTGMVTAVAAVAMRQLGPMTAAGAPAGPVPVPSLLAGLWVLALVGLTGVLGGVGLLLYAVVAAAGALPAWTRRRGAPATAAGGSTTAEAVPADPLPAASAVPALSTPEVCWAWRLSYLRVEHRDCPGYLLDDLAALRRACLDELERRDPAAFHRWLPTARAAGDPARVFCRRSAPG